MPEDRSLDEFAPGDGDADSDAVDAAEAVDADSDAAEGPNAADDAADAADDSASDDVNSDPPSGPSDVADPAAVDPAAATSTWHADGAACDRCGEPVERRWRDEDDFVCADCASW
ncbi:hypothetical protein [Halorubrum sp. Atlit-26R]|uniref:DUF7573 domain-containing protein n=1 Tax=Halorubrum sp. Atlit-26R TaxID=2282128 RepID=UPI000EF17EC8|nr:hypothetical protein [Halorubrum sp. Atlit-26R]RLM72334.1 hypothetical protein DVK07_07110 [Halorubrum sp. Atlit-26R]